MKKEKNKKKFSIVRVLIATVLTLSVVIIAIFFVVFYPFFKGNRLIIPKGKNSNDGLEVLKNIRIMDYCEPISCPNTYIVHSDTQVLKDNFEYCLYSGISGNVSFDFKDLSNFGYYKFGSKKYCKYDKEGVYYEKLACRKGQRLTEYTLFDAFYFFPNFMKKKIDHKFYSCK